jgi:hypothetical protein
MKIIVNQTKLGKLVNRFLNDEGEKYSPTFIGNILKYLHIIGKDEEVGRYILKNIKEGNFHHFSKENDGMITDELNFTIGKSLPLKLTSTKIIFNRGGQDREFSLISPLLGDEFEMDISYSMMYKIYKALLLSK